MISCLRNTDLLQGGLRLTRIGVGLLEMDTECGIVALNAIDSTQWPNIAMYLSHGATGDARRSARYDI